MTLDIRTMMVMLALAAFVTAFFLVIVRRLHLSVRGIGWLAAAQVLGAVGLVTGALRDILPSLLGFLFANVAIVAAYAMQWNGVRGFIGRPGVTWAVVLTSATETGFIVWYYYVDDNFVARVVTSSILLGLCTGLAGWTLLAGPASLAKRVTGWIFVLNALFFAARTVLSVFDGSGVLFQPTVLTVVTFLWGFVFLIASTLGIVMMTSERLQDELNRQASRDPLLDVLNRRAFHLLAEKELARVRRSGGAAAVLMMDLDHFKRLNDEFGHAAGDAMLKAFAAVAVRTLRDQDVFCRHGGEEFVALLPDTELAGAQAVAQRLRVAFAETFVDHDGRCLAGSVSIGVAVAVGRGDGDQARRPAQAGRCRALSRQGRGPQPGRRRRGMRLGAWLRSRWARGCVHAGWLVLSRA